MGLLSYNYISLDCGVLSMHLYSRNYCVMKWYLHPGITTQFKTKCEDPGCFHAILIPRMHSDD